MESMSVKLPSLFQQALEAICRVQACPAEFVLGGMIAAVATASPNYRFRALGYENRPNVWVCVLGASGGGKSPALAAAMSPCMEYQSRANKTRRVERPDFEAEMTRYRSNLKKWAAAKGDAGPKPVKPQPLRLEHRIVDDATYEGLVKRLQDTTGITYYDPELKGWLGSFAKYGTGSSRAAWLKLFDGEAINSVRVDAENDVDVEQPCVSVVGGIQPRILDSFKDGLDDGLTYRLIFFTSKTDRMQKTQDKGFLDDERDFMAYKNALCEFMIDHMRDDKTYRLIASPSASRMLRDWIDRGIDLYGNPDLEGHDEDLQSMYSKIIIYAHKLCGLHAIMRCLNEYKDQRGGAKAALMMGTWQITVEDVQFMDALMTHHIIPAGKRAIEMMNTIDRDAERRLIPAEVVNIHAALPKGVPISITSKETMNMLRERVPSLKRYGESALKSYLYRTADTYPSRFPKGKGGKIFIPIPKETENEA